MIAAMMARYRVLVLVLTYEFNADPIKFCKCTMLTDIA